MIVPNGFSEINLTSPKAGIRIYEVEVTELLLNSFSADFNYDDAGNMTKHTIVLWVSKTAPADDTTKVLEPEVEFDEEQPPIEDHILSNKILIYPNPTRGLLRVQLDGYDPNRDGSAMVSAHSMVGVKVVERVLNEPTTTIDMSRHPAGIYILTVRIGEHARQWRVVKE